MHDNVYWLEPLTQARALQLLAYDDATGVLTWKVKRKGRGSIVPGTVAGSVGVDGYRFVTVDGISYKAARVIVLMMTGAWPQQLVDHKRGDKDDNRWYRLRPNVTHSQNGMNRKVDIRNKTGVTGVCVEYRKDRGTTRYMTYVSIDGRQKLFRFNTLEEAVVARRAMELEHYGVFSRSQSMQNGE